MNSAAKSWLKGLFFAFCLSPQAGATAPKLQHFIPPDGAYIASIPPTWSIHTGYVFNGLGPGRPLPGVLFSIPENATTGTNLSPDGTGVALLTQPLGQPCDASDYLASARIPHELSEGGTLWSTAQSSDAGAGNDYTTEVFARRLDGHCLLVLYLIHSTDILAYPPGQVQPFDRFALLRAFDQVRDAVAPVPQSNPPRGPRPSEQAGTPPTRSPSAPDQPVPPPPSWPVPVPGGTPAPGHGAS